MSDKGAEHEKAVARLDAAVNDALKAVFEAGRREAIAEVLPVLEFYATKGVWGNGCAAIDHSDTYTCDLGVLRGGKRVRALLEKLSGSK